MINDNHLCYFAQQPQISLVDDFFYFSCFFLFFAVQIKQSRTTVKPKQVNINDVYEDMRGTLRR